MYQYLAVTAAIVCQLTSLAVSHNLSSDIANYLKQLDKFRAIRPGEEKGQPDKIELHIRMTSLGPVSENTMDFTTTIYLVERWKDPRLTQSWPASVKGNLIVDGADADHIWRPDTFFLNLKAGTMHLATTPNRYMNVTPAGEVFWAERMTVTLHCKMDLWRFPMDKQNCSIDISSVSHPVNGLQYEWMSDDVAFIVMPSARVNEFQMTRRQTSSCTFESDISGEFPCLRATIFLQRNVASFVITTYIPSTILVVLSWMNFWIDTDLVPARLTLCTTMTLTTVTITAARAAFSMTRALDIWMLVCLVFVGSSFAEIAFVHIVLQKEKIYQQLLKAQEAAAKEEAASAPPVVFVPPPPTASKVELWRINTPSPLQKASPTPAEVPSRTSSNQSGKRPPRLGHPSVAAASGDSTKDGGDVAVPSETGLAAIAETEVVHEIAQKATARKRLAGETVDAEVMLKFLKWKQKAGRFSKDLPKHFYWTNWWSQVRKSTALRMDVCCRVCFPLLFTIWVVVYCIVYNVLLTD